MGVEAEGQDGSLRLILHEDLLGDLVFSLNEQFT